MTKEGLGYLFGFALVSLLAALALLIAGVMQSDPGRGLMLHAIGAVCGIVGTILYFIAKEIKHRMIKRGVRFIHEGW